MIQVGLHVTTCTDSDLISDVLTSQAVGWPERVAVNGMVPVPFLPVLVPLGLVSGFLTSSFLGARIPIVMGFEILKAQRISKTILSLFLTV